LTKGIDSVPLLERSVAPPNSIVFINDPTHICEVPRNTATAIVTATASCIAVWTLAQPSGETTIRLARTMDCPVGQIVFDDMLETPGRRVEVGDSGGEQILPINVDNALTHVKIWVNDTNEPDLILIQAQ
jgi:hypothetical protein